MIQLFTPKTQSAPEIVFGSDVTMTTVDGTITLHAPGVDGRRVIGTYSGPAAAWAALDEIDAPESSVGLRAA